MMLRRARIFVKNDVSQAGHDLNKSQETTVLVI